jgi:hypothetical protein
MRGRFARASPSNHAYETRLGAAKIFSWIDEFSSTKPAKTGEKQRTEWGGRDGKHHSSSRLLVPSQHAANIAAAT